MAAHKKHWSSDFIVSYGPNYSHRKHNGKVFSKYKDAVSFYNSIDRKTFCCGEIVRLDYKFSHMGDLRRIVTKKFYDMDNNTFIGE